MKKKIGKLFLIIMGISILLGVGYIIYQNNVNKTVSVMQLEESPKNDAPPVICLKGEKEITLNEGESYQEQGYSAIDEEEGSIVKKVKIEREEIDKDKYKLIYTVKDSSGNEAKEERIVKIKRKNKSKGEKNKEEKKNNKGIIYLTFDDGPSSNTSKILDILKEEGVNATFFLLNYSDEQENLVKREVAEGNAIGIHGYSHDYGKIYKSVDSYMENLDKLQEKIYKSTGEKTTITRFPGGSSNTISDFNPGIMTKLSKEVEKRGYQYCDWNVDSNDAGGSDSENEIYKNVVNGLFKNGRNVVLMHDANGKGATVKALKKIIKYGKENGYSFQVITPETEMVHHGIAN